MKMNSPYNLALVLLRVFGCIAVFLALLGFVFAASFVVLLLVGVPDWFSQSVAPYAIQSAVGSPLWLIGGFIIILLSRRLASFIVKACEPSVTAP
jgi:hypothetical protein